MPPPPAAPPLPETTSDAEPRVETPTKADQLHADFRAIIAERRNRTFQATPPFPKPPPSPAVVPRLPAPPVPNLTPPQPAEPLPPTVAPRPQSTEPAVPAVAPPVSIDAIRQVSVTPSSERPAVKSVNRYEPSWPPELKPALQKLDEVLKVVPGHITIGEWRGKESPDGVILEFLQGEGPDQHSLSKEQFDVLVRKLDKEQQAIVHRYYTFVTDGIKAFYAQPLVAAVLPVPQAPRIEVTAEEIPSLNPPSVSPVSPLAIPPTPAAPLASETPTSAPVAETASISPAERELRNKIDLDVGQLAQFIPGLVLDQTKPLKLENGQVHIALKQGNKELTTEDFDRYVADWTPRSATKTAPAAAGNPAALQKLTDFKALLREWGLLQQREQAAQRAPAAKGLWGRLRSLFGRK